MKTAIISGASKGIGKAIAIKLTQMGYSLAIYSRSLEDLNNLKLELDLLKVDEKQTFLVAQVDASSKVEVQDFAKKVLKLWDNVDLLVNNVGIFRPGLSSEESDDNFESQLDVNLMACYYLTKTLIPQLKLKKNGQIVNICSVASLNPVVEAGSYSVTKAAMLSLNHVWRKELAPFGIKVTAIIPGSTFTSSWADTLVDSEALIQASDIADCLASILTLSKHANIDEIRISPLNY